jgi:hypothetical protein
MLIQPWGTDLLFENFKKPVFQKNNFVFWIGSVWNNRQNQGNIFVIREFKKVLEKFSLKFIHLRFIPNFLNIFFIRLSRIAPAIAGAWQVEHDYLPCRMFKNISYGQVGFSNVKKFADLLQENNISGSLEDMTKRVLELNKKEYQELVLRQQAKIKNYTYKEALENIFRAFQEIQNKYKYK